MQYVAFKNTQKCSELFKICSWLHYFGEHFFKTFVLALKRFKKGGNGHCFIDKQNTFLLNTISINLHKKVMSSLKQQFAWKNWRCLLIPRTFCIKVESRGLQRFHSKLRSLNTVSIWWGCKKWILKFCFFEAKRQIIMCGILLSLFDLIKYLPSVVGTTKVECTFVTRKAAYRIRKKATSNRCNSCPRKTHLKKKDSASHWF